ncbi:FixH family protein [Photobacterium sp. SDRW27]|uniref:FixH family protein n=1 Tax=Photobacterium obscurum TaxID=2829490 RepID=UPI0022449F98|nr:FixH family protein [Photobacterium obscurum]MCW8331416.1 FixH family protein [Photobacterium obscurum]
MNTPSWSSSSFPITLHTNHYTITAQPIELPLPLNKIHAWVIHITTPSGQPVKGMTFQVTGGMPAHQHGLPTQPKLINEPKHGEYIIDGFKFNMIGKLN